MKAILKAVTVFALAAVTPLLAQASDKVSSFGECLALAPDGEQFTIDLNVKVDTSSKPAQKKGTGVSQTAMAQMLLTKQKKSSNLL